MSILETKELYFTYPDGDSRRVILNHVNTSFEKGKFYTILGSSGCGKTTFLSLIGALDKPESGEILYNGKNITEIGYEKFRRNHIGIVFQNYNLINYMSGLENVMVALGITENKITDDLEKHALEILNSVGIDEKKARRKIKRLSGGEQQRVAIARALATNVDVILADEPTGNLDRATSDTIVELFKELAHERNKCVIVVTHSNEVANKSDVIMRMNTYTQDFSYEIN